MPPRTLRRTALARIALASLASLAAAPLGAQDYIAKADSLFRSGMIFQAESLYYSAVRYQTREPAARLALGRYYAARGQLRPGAVLMEEARYFGGDAKTIAIYLAPVYFALGDWRALATLPASPLTPTERAQAAWLVSNPPTLAMSDSVAVSYRPSTDTLTLGRLTLRIGEQVLEATIDPRRSGIMLDGSRRA